MNVRPSILCPIDYSPASAGALHYAAAVAGRFVTRLIVLAVDPRPAGAVDPGARARWIRHASEERVARFVTETFGAGGPTPAICECDVAAGTPSVEILRIARERSCDLIVMSSHGCGGARKRPCGSTTERVLCETTVPVLLTPPANSGPVNLGDASLVTGIMMPVYPSPPLHHAHVAQRLMETFNLPLVQVIERVSSELRA